METIPLCPSCKHNHEQGIKCKICGHVGKSQIFQKMRIKADEKRALRSEFLTSRMVNSALPLFDLVQSLLPSPHLVGNEYASYQYILLQKGDISLGIGVFELLYTDTLYLRYIHIVEEYRHKHYAYHILYEIIQYLAENQALLKHIVFPPCPEGVGEKLRGAGALPPPPSLPFPRDSLVLSIDSMASLGQFLRGKEVIE